MEMKKCEPVITNTKNPYGSLPSLKLYFTNL